MRIVNYSQDIISLYDSEFIAASLQEGLFTFTRPNGQVVEVKLPTRAEIAKLPNLHSISKAHAAQTSLAFIFHEPEVKEIFFNFLYIFSFKNPYFIKK